MSEHSASISWHKQGSFSHEGFERGHEAAISGHTIPMSGANTPAFVDPEQMLAASLASCHMQTFLALAAKKRLQVERYEDTATAKVDTNSDGKQYVSEVRLTPKAVFTGDKRPTQEEIEKMHHKAHEHCFVSNSLISSTLINPIF
ncbi:MAG: organic hydroperoxide reductase OsmC/OhrA [Bermanella sp.]|jgi:organic hydroperoxide reductase OsmC/OhrA